MKMQRQMPDRIKDDWSNLPEVVEQFRQLGRSDTYILETLVSVVVERNKSEEFFEKFEKKKKFNYERD